MKENSFKQKKNVLSKSNDNIILLKSKEEDSKVIQKEKSFQTQNNNLINFISNSHKFTFSSAFDHKGAKLFLKSKEKALDEIVIDEDSQSHKKDKKNLLKNNADDEGNSNKKKRKEMNTDISPLSIKSKFQSKIEDEKEEKLYKINARKNHCRKEFNNFKFWNNKNDEKIMNDIGLKMPKASSKFCSRLELRMFNDKSLNKIKPIKVTKPKYTHNNLKFPEFNENNRKASTKSDASLIKLVSEISQV